MNVTFYCQGFVRRQRMLMRMLGVEKTKRFSLEGELPRSSLPWQKPSHSCGGSHDHPASQRFPCIGLARLLQPTNKKLSLSWLNLFYLINFGHLLRIFLHMCVTLQSSLNEFNLADGIQFIFMLKTGTRRFYLLYKFKLSHSV